MAAACTVKEAEDDGDGGSGNTDTTTTTGDGGTGGVNTGGQGGQGGALTCEDECANAVPSTSVDTWLEMVGCTYCYACFDICDGGTGNICEAGEEGPNACSTDAASLDCISCVNSTCSQTDTCGTEVDNCLADENCVAFNQCYTDCG